jgi:hypothetical protein
MVRDLGVAILFILLYLVSSATAQESINSRAGTKYLPLVVASNFPKNYNLYTIPSQSVSPNGSTSGAIEEPPLVKFGIYGGMNNNSHTADFFQIEWYSKLLSQI